jgi:transcription antitermination factor NusG
MSETWHVWVVKSGKFNKVSKFITEEVPEVEEILYPRVRKEHLVRDRIVIKTVALYMNYIFVRIKDENFDTVVDKFNDESVITTYVGPCYGEGLEKVYKMKEIEDKRKENPSFLRGDKVKIISGSFQGLEGTVKEIKKNSIVAEVHILGRETKIALPPEILDFV